MASTIYFLKTEDGAAIKIGYVGNEKRLNKRIQSLQVGNHKKLELVHTESADPKIEKRIHKLLWPFKLSGEWFDYTENQVQTFVAEVSAVGVYNWLGGIRTISELKAFERQVNLDKIRGSGAQSRAQAA